jgi:hypothetical protein
MAFSSGNGVVGSEANHLASALEQTTKIPDCVQPFSSPFRPIKSGPHPAGRCYDMCLSTVDSLTTCFCEDRGLAQRMSRFPESSHESARNKRQSLAQQCRMLRFMLWLRLLGSDLYTLSTYFRPVSFRTSEVPISINGGIWVWLGAVEAQAKIFAVDLI